MENDNRHTVEQSIMEKIAAGEVKPRSRYIFLAEHAALVVGFLFLLVVAALLSSIVLWYTTSSDMFTFLAFGREGVPAFVESLPYALMIEIVLCVVLAAVILRHTDWSYKKPRGFVIFALVGVVFLGGSALAATSISERVNALAEATQKKHEFLRPFITEAPAVRTRGVTGRVAGVGEGYVTIETAAGPIAIDVATLPNMGSTTLMQGGYLTVVGKNSGEVFEARKIRILEQKEAPGVRQRVEEHFGLANDETFVQKRAVIHREKGKKYCLFTCEKEKKELSYCEEWCAARFRTGPEDLKPSPLLESAEVAPRERSSQKEEQQNRKGPPQSSSYE